MKILLTGDWHVGTRGDSNIYLKIFNDWIDKFLIPTIKNENVECLCVLGDIFDNRNSLSPKSIKVAINAFKKIHAKYPKLRIILICGNHDIYYKNTRDVNSLEIIYEKVPNIEIILTQKDIEIDGKIFRMCPWPVNNEEVDELFSKKADICLGHFEITNFYLVKNVKEKKGLSPKKFKETFTKTYSGHYHINQESDGIRYIGSPYHINWNDYDDVKGVYILDPQKMTETFIENKTSPIYEKVFLSKLKAGTSKLSTVKDNFVQLVLDEKCPDKVVEKLQTMILSKNPQSLDIDGLNLDHDLTVEDMDEGLTKPIEYLVDYTSKCTLPGDYDYDRDKIGKMIQELYVGVGG